MAVEDRRKSDSEGEGGGEKPQPEKKDDGGEHRAGISELRRRWELATVLDFLNVFEEVIGKDLEISAEEIESGLISPNTSLAKLHITLLKGIPPVHKAFNGSDAWVAVLCMKLAPWWPWVAEGEIPLKAAKGEEMSGYNELSPTKRLLLLRALCEIRADQHDAVDYINDALKQGTKISLFCKDKIAGHQNGTSFWYEGNTLMGPRLYRGVTTYHTTEQSEGKECSEPPSFEWETLATNLEEFRKVVDDFSSSNVVAETAVSKFVETEAIPPLEKVEKQKEREEKRKQRQAMLLNERRSSYAERATRSCRNHRPVNYSCDEYDRVMKEAIRLTRRETKPEQQGERSDDSDSEGSVSATTNGFPVRKRDSEDGSGKRVCSEDEKADKPGKTNKAMDDDNDYSFSGKGVSDTDFSDSGDSKMQRATRRGTMARDILAFGGVPE